MDWGLATWLGLGFGLGLIHAFDADHVMAVSIFATRPDAKAGGNAGRSRGDAPSAARRGFASGARTGLRWALGHGAALLLCGVALWVLGQRFADPLAGAAWSEVAERVVGVMMIGLGCWVLYEIGRSHAHLHFHAHDDLPPHAHWHVHASHHGEAGTRDAAGRSRRRPVLRRDDHGTNHEHRHEHAPVFVGGVHGLAGSAPMFAVIPAAAHSPYLGLAYLACFTVGVAIAMAAVSGVLGHFTERLAAPSATVRSVASGSVRAHGVANDLCGFDAEEQSRVETAWSPLTLIRGVSASGSILVGLWMVGVA